MLQTAIKTATIMQWYPGFRTEFLVVSIAGNLLKICLNCFNCPESGTVNSSLNCIKLILNVQC